MYFTHSLMNFYGRLIALWYMYKVYFILGDNSASGGHKNAFFGLQLWYISLCLLYCNTSNCDLLFPVQYCLVITWVLTCFFSALKYSKADNVLFFYLMWILEIVSLFPWNISVLGHIYIVLFFNLLVVKNKNGRLIGVSAIMQPTYLTVRWWSDGRIPLKVEICVHWPGCGLDELNAFISPLLC